MVRVTRPKRREKVTDMPLSDGRELSDPGGGQVPVVAPQVATVGRQGVGGQSALDREVVEPGRRDASDRGQTSTSDSGTTCKPCACATGSYVHCPATVLTPRANAGSAAQAAASPRSAISTT